MQKLLIFITAFLFFILTACGTGGSSVDSDTLPYGESVVAVSGYSCISVDGVATATVSMTTAESINPEAYIEISTTVESQISIVNQEGNCTTDNESFTPMCVYTFKWEQTTAPLQTLYFQLNGNPGPYFLTTMNVGGPICQGVN